MNEDEPENANRVVMPALVKPIVLFLQVFHWVIVAYSALGWLANSRGWLLFYLVYLPVMMIQWYFNENTCIVNNIETWLKTDRWRREGNPEEGAFIHTAFVRLTGWQLPANAFDILIRCVMATLWIVALVKLRGLSG